MDDKVNLADKLVSFDEAFKQLELVVVQVADDLGRLVVLASGQGVPGGGQPTAATITRRNAQHQSARP
jgi:hypothetical protein